MAIKLLRRSKFRQNLFGNIHCFKKFSSNRDPRANATATSYQSIADFYSGKSVFVTGGTGFCGKVLIEKLLRSCTGLDKIYLLVRDNEGANVNGRLKDMFANPLFSRIKETNPSSINKVVPVKGDLTLPHMGINAEEKQTLIDKVSVVFHVAATVKFNEPLSPPMKINYEGTKKVLDLCKGIKNMQGFICFSTAFAHTQRPILSERIYPAPADVEEVYNFIEMHGNDKALTQKFLRGRDNPYCLVKAIMESYVAKNHGHVPTAIIRPSAVSATINEPVVGWVDNWYGATGLFQIVGKGWDHISLGDRSCVADLIPVDYVANLSIVAGARIKGSKDIQVYNSTTSAENPITWADALEYVIKESVYKGYNEVPYPSVVHLKSKALVDFLTKLQIIPAHIADIFLRLRGKDPKYAKVVSQAIRFRKAYEVINCQTFTMEADRAIELFNKLSPEDQKHFRFNPTHIDWSKYIRDYFNNISRYLEPKFTVKSGKVWQ